MSRLSRRKILQGALTLAGIGTITGWRRAYSQQSEPIRIGLLTPLSGPLATVGNEIQMGAEFAASYFNAHGGIAGRKLELLFRDTRANPNDAVAAVREVLNSGVKLISGGTMGFEALGMGPIVQDASGLMIVHSAQANAVTHEGFRRNVFRAADNGIEVVNGFVQIAVQKYPDATEWGSLIADTASSRDVANIFVESMTTAFSKLGKKIHFHDPILVKLGAPEAKNQISEIMSSPIQGLFSEVYGADGISTYSQAHAFGMQNKIKAILDYGNNFTFAKALKANLPSFWGTLPWYHGLYPSDPISNAAFKYYISKADDQYPPGELEFGFGAVSAYKSAIEATNGSTDTEHLVRAFESKMQFPTLKGPAYFREDHQMVGDLNYLYFEPRAEEPGFRVADMIKLDGSPLLERATPGKAYTL